MQQGGREDQLPHQPRQPHPHVLRAPPGVPHLGDPDVLHPVGGGLTALAVAPGAVLPPGLPAAPRFRPPAPLSCQLFQSASKVSPGGGGRPPRRER